MISSLCHFYVLFSINMEKSESTQIARSVKKTSLSSKDDSSGHWQPVATTGVYFKNNFICRHPWFQLYSTTIKRRRLGMHGRLAALIACVRL